MKKQETGFEFLKQFLPDNTFEQVMAFFKHHTIHLTITHERKSILGDYRNPTKEKPYHRISINANLNAYSFLITLLHELAHMLTYMEFKHRVSPHGKEWKTQFRHTSLPFTKKNIFPHDVELALQDYLNNPAASTCTDPGLYKALYKYDKHKQGHKLVEQIEVNQHFETEDGRIFQKLLQLRTRSQCKELKTGKIYLFQGVVEVKALPERKAG